MLKFFEDLWTENCSVVFFMGELSGQSADSFVVGVAVELSNVGDYLVFIAVVYEAKEVFEVGEDGEEMGWEAFQWDILKCSDHDALSLID